MRRNFVWTLVCAMIMLAAASPADAFFGKKKKSCEPVCESVSCETVVCESAPCETVVCEPTPCYQLVEKTILVPHWVTEKRVREVTHYRHVKKERPITIHKMVKMEKQVPYEYTTYEHQTRVRKETYHVCIPYTEEQVYEYTVCVPHQEKRQGVRKVCRYQETIKHHTVMEDHGCWVETVCEVPCYSHSCCGDSCCGTVCTVRRTWQPKCVEKTVEVKCMVPVTVDEPFEYTVCVYHSEKRQGKRIIHKSRTEERSRDIQYTVCVPKTNTGMRTVIECKWVPEPSTETYFVCEPYTVQEEYEVKVCHQVEQKVTYKVAIPTCCEPSCEPVCEPSCGWNSCSYRKGGWGCGSKRCR